MTLQRAGEDVRCDHGDDHAGSAGLHGDPVQLRSEPRTHHPGRAAHGVSQGVKLEAQGPRPARQSLLYGPLHSLVKSKPKKQFFNSVYLLQAGHLLSELSLRSLPKLKHGAEEEDADGE